MLLGYSKSIFNLRDRKLSTEAISSKVDDQMEKYLTAGGFQETNIYTFTLKTFIHKSVHYAFHQILRWLSMPHLKNWKSFNIPT